MSLVLVSYDEVLIFMTVSPTVHYLVHVTSKLSEVYSIFCGFLKKIELYKPINSIVSSVSVLPFKTKKVVQTEIVLEYRGVFSTVRKNCGC